MSSFRFFLEPYYQYDAAKSSRENLVKKIDWLALEISDNLQLLRGNKKTEGITYGQIGM